MKKFIPLIITSLFIAACQQPVKENPNLAATPQTPTQTLNGFSKTDAQNMVTEFNHHRTGRVKLKHTQALITKTQFSDMLDLLNKEASNINNTTIPDGIRIYFANNIGTGPKESSNNVIVVSTYQGKPFQSNGIVLHEHIDYFVHPNAKPALKWDILHDTNSSNGAKLFDQCTNCNTINCPGRVPDPDHDVTREDASKMVDAFNKDQTLIVNSSAVWFSLNQLKKFLNDMRNGEDGIRIYFARHNKDITEDPNSGYCTFVFVPTINKIDHYDCNNTRVTLFEGNKTTKELVSPANDNGELCPIYCTGASL